MRGCESQELSMREQLMTMGCEYSTAADRQVGSRVKMASRLLQLGYGRGEEIADDGLEIWMRNNLPLKF